MWPYLDLRTEPDSATSELVGGCLLLLFGDLFLTLDFVLDALFLQHLIPISLLLRLLLPLLLLPYHFLQFLSIRHFLVVLIDLLLFGLNVVEISYFLHALRGT